MGGISACGVDASRLASVEHTFKPPPMMSDSGPGNGVGSSGGGSSSTGTGNTGGGGGGVGGGGGSTSGPPAPPNAAPKSSVTLNGGNSSSRKKTSVVGPPPAAGLKSVAEVHDIVGIEDGDIATRAEEDQGGARLGLLGMMASAIRETDPQESVAIEGLARKLVGREYFLDPRVFNHRQVFLFSSIGVRFSGGGLGVFVLGCALGVGGAFFFCIGVLSPVVFFLQLLAVCCWLLWLL